MTEQRGGKMGPRGGGRWEGGKEGDKPGKDRLKGGRRDREKRRGGAKTGNPAPTARVLFCHWVAVTERGSQERNNRESERARDYDWMPVTE